MSLLWLLEQKKSETRKHSLGAQQLKTDKRRWQALQQRIQIMKNIALLIFISLVCYDHPHSTLKYSKHKSYKSFIESF